MSQDVERETTFSTAKSLFAALLALGAGFLFLFSALVTTIGEAGSVYDDDSAVKALGRMVRSDLIDLVPGSLRVSANGRELTFSVNPSKPQQIHYRFDGESGEVFREQKGQTPNKIGRLKRLVFAKEASLLSMEWNTSHDTVRRTWALDRWTHAKGAK